MAGVVAMASMTGALDKIHSETLIFSASVVSNNGDTPGAEAKASAFTLLGTNKGFPLSPRCIIHVFRIGRALSTLYIDQRHMLRGTLYATVAQLYGMFALLFPF